MKLQRSIVLDWCRGIKRVEIEVDIQLPGRKVSANALVH